VSLVSRDPRISPVSRGCGHPAQPDVLGEIGCVEIQASALVLLSGSCVFSCFRGVVGTIVLDRPDDVLEFDLRWGMLLLLRHEGLRTWSPDWRPRTTIRLASRPAHEAGSGTGTLSTPQAPLPTTPLFAFKRFADKHPRSGAIWRGIEVRAPLWLALVPLAPWPVWCLGRRTYRWYARKKGCCRACGYDLRGTDQAESCPECGVARSKLG